MYVNHLTVSAHSTSFVTLPTEYPSIWDFSTPGKASSWVAPAFVFVLQAWLTAGFYGTLIRLNTRNDVSLATFIVDASRAFWRLFLWTFLWNGFYMFVLSLSGVAPRLAVPLAAFTFMLRFIFLFSNAALVYDRQTSIRSALQTSIRALVTGLLPMLPYAVVIALMSNLAFYAAAHSSFYMTLIISIVYGIAMTWVLHLIVARYLYFSRLRTVEKTQAVSS